MPPQISPDLAKRIHESYYVWLTTVNADGTPQTTPVWFIPDGDTYLIYSMPEKQKLRNIAGNPRVALSHNADEEGEDFFVITGNAAVDNTVPRVIDNPPYVEKYEAGIIRIGMSVQSMSDAYHVPIRVTPTRVRGE